MTPRSVWLSPLLLALIAIAIVAAGARLARQTESVRLPHDRQPLYTVEESLQKELTRLDALYERHLLNLARHTNFPPSPPRDALAWLVGLRQFSLLHPVRSGENRPDFHLPVNTRMGERLPEPIFSEIPLRGLPRPNIKLSSSALLEGEKDYGWIQQPGQPPLFWARRDPGEVAVLLIDTAAARSAVNGWLARWAQEPFRELQAGGGPDALLTPDDQPLLSVGTVAASPNLLLPLRTHLGTWYLASWDRLETRTRYDSATLLGAAMVATVLLLAALLVYFQQRSALRLAAQRVSFVNSVSHELRTPLTNMLLNLDLIAPHTADAGANRLALVRDEAGRLGRLIENVLTYSRGEQGRLSLRSTACQPTSVIGSVLEQFEAAFARREITVQTTLPTGGCMLDADALAQIAANLFSNVEKYAPGSTMTVTATVEDEMLILRVADTGPGIPSGARDRIFQPFERLNARLTEGVTGTGLGLAIARELALHMGGSLQLLPSEFGALFELKVPARAIATPRIEAA
jgi:signal transduction histidine kinase